MDVKCKVCGEAWSYWGLLHGDVQAWEADAIKDGIGCPHCEGYPPEGGYEPENLSDFEYGDEDCILRLYAQSGGMYGPPPVEVLETCIGCGIQRVRDFSAEVYNGSHREPVYDWFAPVGSDADRWQVEHELSCYDPSEPMARFHGMGPACAHCCDECADCDTVIAMHRQGAFASLDCTDDGVSYLPEGCYDSSDLRCLDCYLRYASESESE